MQSRMSDKAGTAIRKLRLARGWNLATLSDKTGIPISTLSRVELGQNALKYDKLMRLCQALEVDLEGLVARDVHAEPPPQGRRSLVRAGEGEPVRLGLLEGRMAGADLLGRALTPVVAELAPGGPQTIAADGEAYLLALAGVVELRTQHYAPLRLSEGDAVYFDAAPEFSLASLSGPARVLLVLAGHAGLAD